MNHLGQVPAVTISFNLASDAPLGDATRNIDRYKRDKGLKPWKVWRINSDNMPDAVRPVPLTNNERCQRYKAKQDRKAGKLDWRGLRAA